MAAPWQHRNAVWVETSLGVAIRIFERIAVAEDGSRRRVNSNATLAPGEHAENEAWLHLVNPDGTTRVEVPEMPGIEVKLASREAIPASRVEHLTDEKLAALGYA
jgi:hypothetical protein